MGRGTPRNGGRGTARNNGPKNGNGARTNKLDVSVLGLVSPLGGGASRGALNALHAKVGLGGLQQQNQLLGLLGGGTGLQTTGGVSTELAGLCALLGLRLAVASSYFECNASSTSTTSHGSSSSDKEEGGGSCYPS